MYSIKTKTISRTENASLEKWQGYVIIFNKTLMILLSKATEKIGDLIEEIE